MNALHDIDPTDQPKQGIAQAQTLTFEGLTPQPVAVQVQITGGLPAFMVVGLADRTVSESKERIRGALASMGVGLPARRVVVSLSPADLHKVGSHFDLPIAVALLAAMGMVDPSALAETLILGELDLMANVCAVAGVLPAGMYAHERGWTLVCPKANGAEALWVSDTLPIVATGHLQALVQHMRGERALPPPTAATVTTEDTPPEAGAVTLGFIRGQPMAKRAIEVAAAGGHNLLMRGPPGVGKTMLANAMRGLLPPLTRRETLEVASIHSLAGVVYDDLPTRQRPFRAPHHNASMASLVGGGARARPGEVSLAHGGVLFLDEVPEFSPSVLDALRQPMESGQVSIARARAHVTYPASFQFVGAMNPCRCAGEYAGSCRRGMACAEAYRDRLSGALQDRIDLFVDLHDVDVADLTATIDATQAHAETTAAKHRTIEARSRQHTRYTAVGALEGETNATVSYQVVEESCNLRDNGKQLVERAVRQMRLSARGYHRLIRVARTIADIDGATFVGDDHVREALVYRRF